MDLESMRARRSDLTAKVREATTLANEELRELTADEQAQCDDYLQRAEHLTASIDREERVYRLEDRGRELITAPEKPAVGSAQPVAQPKSFRSFGEQLRAVVRASRPGGSVDGRLIETRALGAAEAIGSDGGFLVQPDFAAEIFKRSYDLAAVASRCRKIPIGAQFNGTKIPAINESSRVDGSRWGGVNSYWVGEGDAYTATRPKFRLMDITLKKLVGLAYATDEMLADSSQLESIITQAFTEEIAFKLDDGCINGSGAGTPLGILNSGSLVTVAKESGQTNTTVVSANITKMWGRCWARSRQNSVWFINQDVETQLYGLTLGTATVNQAVYVPPGGLSVAPYATLMGRPVVPIEQAATLGNVGDIILADMSQYVLADKGGVQMASSMHVQFLTDEQVFRFTYRADGQPLWNVALTPFKGTNTLSPFVALAARP